MSDKSDEKTEKTEKTEKIKNTDKKEKSSFGAAAEALGGVEDLDDGANELTDEKPSYEELHEDLLNTQALATENYDKMMRAMAELENVRARSARDVSNAHKFALEKMVNELLPVIDSLEQGLEAARGDENSDAILEGMQLTLDMFLNVLKKFQVEPVSPDNEAFNADLHEAMSMQEVEGVSSGTVIAVIQKGYLLHGRVVRPARVVVAK